MVKTEQQIERDFYSFIKDSPLGKTVKGGVYRSDMRPDNAHTEDLVVKFLAGLDEQVQSGVVIVNVYVADVPYQKTARKVSDKARIGELQALIQSFVNDNANTEYRMQTDVSPTTMAVEGMEQHVVYARIRFYRLSS
nr:MAG TPA: hypothetical protein [Caudoviricetes sp.]